MAVYMVERRPTARRPSSGLPSRDVMRMDTGLLIYVEKSYLPCLSETLLICLHFSRSRGIH